MTKFNGDALVHPADIARFWTRVHRHRPESCWVWIGYLDKKGYGHHLHHQAHRIAYALLVGPIPKSLTLDHLCRYPACVNPAHLEPVTRGENSLRGKTIVAANTTKTHCPKGHPYAGANLYIHPSGRRVCRRCATDASLAYQERRRLGQPRGKAALTHCRRGHPLTVEENVYIHHSTGDPACRTCSTIARQMREAQKRKGSA